MAAVTPLLLAAAPAPPVSSFGIGVASCATWLADDGSKTLGEQWLLGFWTGANVLSGRSVGRSTDPHGIVGEVELACQAQPSAPLSAVTSATWNRFRQAGR